MEIELNKNKNNIYLDVDLNLIQNLRFIQALMESNYNIVIKDNDIVKLTELERLFNVKYETNFYLSTEINDYEILHDKPLTQIGLIKRNLVFPHSIVIQCKNLWKQKREYKCSFAGLITEKRRIILNKYIINNTNTKLLEPIKLDSGYKNIFNKLKNYLNIIPEINQHNIGDIIFWSSTRGRTFPIKAWDKDYFDLLSNSTFVLCPNGDFIWTYRFFEAILCGAIPIIEDSCDLYDGFRFKTLNDNLAQLEYSKEDAEFNYNLCVERLTIPLTELNNEIKKLSND